MFADATAMVNWGISAPPVATTLGTAVSDAVMDALGSVVLSREEGECVGGRRGRVFVVDEEDGKEEEEDGSEREARVQVQPYTSAVHPVHHTRFYSCSQEYKIGAVLQLNTQESPVFKGKVLDKRGDNRQIRILVDSGATKSMVAQTIASWLPNRV